MAVAASLRGPSQTAVLTALARDLYRQEQPPVVLDDYLASGLASEEGLALRRRLQAQVPRSHLLAFCRWVCVRSRYAEDLVDAAASRGVEQYVILGAGLDSFAYRDTDRHLSLRVFEVDHPASQAWKRRRLRTLGVEHPSNLVFAPVDFERETLHEGLEAAGFDFALPAVYSWIGVTMYLSLAAINATLTTIARNAPGTQLALTYNQPSTVLDDLSAKVTATFASIATELGEPFISLFVPDQITDLLRQHAFDQIEHFGPDEARVTYFQEDQDVSIAGAQRLVTGTVAPIDSPTPG